jgi:RHS repeat-associated protein
MLDDPDAGITESKFNGFGELEWTEHKKTQADGTIEAIRTEYIYDDARRVIKQIRNGEQITKSYNEQSGFLSSISKPGHQITYIYDENGTYGLGKVTTIVETIDLQNFESKIKYDEFGRVEQHTYPSGYYTKNIYDDFSNLTSIMDKSGRLIWMAKETNAKGQLTSEQKGVVTTQYEYDNITGQPNNIMAGSIIDQSYNFSEDGNLEWRRDVLTNQKEIFTYDVYNQLKTWDIERDWNIVSQGSLDYDAHGNITEKSDIGYAMNYTDSIKIHALTSISGNPELISDIDQNISYTDFKKVEFIEEGNNTLTLSYGIDEQRRKGEYNINGNSFTRYYLGAYEEEHSLDGVKKTHYLSVPNGLAAIYIENDGDGELYYAYTDYLGSLTAITDENGVVIEHYSFDAWGNRRNPDQWELPDTRTSFLTDRGFTMHEHLDGFSLINMNGRVYDPQVGRFLSPDPYIQSPGNWLNYNRYAYCLNNPLIYTDPSGEFWNFFNSSFNGADVAYSSGGVGRAGDGMIYTIGAATNYNPTMMKIAEIADEIAYQVSMYMAFQQIPLLEIPLGNSGLAFKVTPQVAVGSDGVGLGANASLGFDFGAGFNIGLNTGGTYYSSALGTGASGFEGRIGYGIGYEGKNFQAGIGSNYFFSGETSQQTGQMYIGGGKWKLTYENDTWAPVPGLLSPGGADVDKFRTAAMRLDITGGRLKGTNAGFNLFTGESNGLVDANGNFVETSERYRFGAIYAGYGNYRAGYNSERNVRGPIQNGFHDKFNYPHFEVLSISDRFYGGYYSSNPYTLW